MKNINMKITFSTIMSLFIISLMLILVADSLPHLVVSIQKDVLLGIITGIFLATKLLINAFSNVGVKMMSDNKNDREKGYTAVIKMGLGLGLSISGFPIFFMASAQGSLLSYAGSIAMLLGLILIADGKGKAEEL